MTNQPMTTRADPRQRGADMTVHRLDDHRPFDIGTPMRCWKCGTSRCVGYAGGDGGAVYKCPDCPHPAD